MNKTQNIRKEGKNVKEGKTRNRRELGLTELCIGIEVHFIQGKQPISRLGLMRAYFRVISLMITCSLQQRKIIDIFFLI